jgi:nucleoside 2-deoxyribosyltransferase
MDDRASIYLAGPLGFSEVGRHFCASVLVPLLTGLGYRVVDPWTLTDDRAVEAVRRLPLGAKRRRAWARLNHRIAAENRAAIDAAESVVAVLDGPDVDSGTAAEIGYAFARGKRIVGYRGDYRLSADNEGGLVNLQVEYFIRESGGAIAHRAADLARDLGPPSSAPGRARRPARRAPKGASR